MYVHIITDDNDTTHHGELEAFLHDYQCDQHKQGFIQDFLFGGGGGITGGGG